jgi:hypothetical protein
LKKGRISSNPVYQTLESEMAVSSASAKVTPEAQLRSLIAKFGPEDQRLIRSVRSAMRKRLPTANELIYDYNTFFVIGYSPSEHGIESIASIAARADGVRLYLMNGPQLPDPKKLLVGSAKQVRFIHVEAASRLKHPDVEALIAAAIEHASVPLPSKGLGRLVTKASAATKRPRRKPAK